MGDNQNQTLSGASAGADAEETNKGGAVLVTEEELKKSIAALESVVAGSPNARKEALFQKSMSGNISESEKLELMKLIGGESLNKSLSEEVDGKLATDGNAALEKSFDVSPFIDHLNEGITSAIKSVAEHIEKSDTKHHEQVVVLAKGLLDLGKAISNVAQLQKSMADQLGVAMRQPARAPKAQGSAAPAGAVLNKSFGNQEQPDPSKTLQKSEISDLLLEMNMSSEDGVSKSGENIGVAASKFEQLGQISKELLQEVFTFRAAKNGANGVNAR